MNGSPNGDASMLMETNCREGGRRPRMPEIEPNYSYRIYHFESQDTPETKMTVLLCWIEDLRSEVSRLTLRVAELERRVKENGQ
jgi:hypothetical protein